MEDNDESAEPPGSPHFEELAGPMAYRNWQAMKRLGGEPSSGSEFLLYGDAPVIGNDWSVGPYDIVNTVAWNTEGMPYAPPLALTVWVYLPYEQWSLSMKETNLAAFTGTNNADEVAVLLSLITARRLQAGGIVRQFKSVHAPGRARADGSMQMPQVPGRARRLPRQTQPNRISDDQIGLLASYPDLTGDAAVALVRAARAYRDAIWIGESQPEVAWLLLVSAVECAANADKRAAEVDPVVRLRASRRDLTKQMRALRFTDEQERMVAKQTAHLFKTGQKFTDFLMRFGPSEGPMPPPNGGAFPWADEDAKRQALDLVYDHRCNALHEALPIPYPMLLQPHADEEVPLGLATSALNGVWRREDTPMLLHTFEYLVQNALVNWWRSLAFPEASTAAGESA